MQNDRSEIEYLRIIYSEIIKGYYSSDGLYVKHLSEIENGDLSRKKSILFEKLKLDGLQTEKEKIEQLISSEVWSKEKETEIEEYQVIISDNEKNLSRVIAQQHGPIKDLIRDYKIKLSELIIEKRDLIGATVEEYAEKGSFNYFIYLSFYKNEALSERMFGSETDIEDLSDEDLNKYSRLLDFALRRYEEETIKKISVLPFFLNYFSQCKESPSNFIGKPVSSFSPYQLILLSFGLRNLNILSNSVGDPPELVGETKVQDIVNWYDMNFSILLTKNQQSSAR